MSFELLLLIELFALLLVLLLLLLLFWEVGEEEVLSPSLDNMAAKAVEEVSTSDTTN